MSESDADERLLVEAAQRDSSKFGDLYERHFERVYAFVVRRVPDRDAAEDLFYLYVPDVDATYHRALAAGATSIGEPTDRPYGDRNGSVKDAFGNQWHIATQIRDRDSR
jgi:uncharacterized glyoxalase superfamily protein PhnB